MARKRQRVDSSGRATSSSRTPRDESGIRDPKVKNLKNFTNVLPNCNNFARNDLLIINKSHCMETCGKFRESCSHVSGEATYLMSISNNIISWLQHTGNRF